MVKHFISTEPRSEQANLEFTAAVEQLGETIQSIRHVVENAPEPLRDTELSNELRVRFERVRALSGSLIVRSTR